VNYLFVFDFLSHQYSAVAQSLTLGNLTFGPKSGLKWQTI